MNAETKIAQQRLSLLELAQVLGNVAEGLKGAVQGVCRVRVDEVGFGEVEGGAPMVVDERQWG